VTRRKAEIYELRDGGGSPLGNASFKVQRGEPVEVADDVTAYRVLDFQAELHTLGYDAAGRLVLDDPPSRYVLEEFTMRRSTGESFAFEGVERDGRPITAEAVRSIPVDSIAGEVRRVFGAEGAELDPDTVAELRQAGMRDERALRYVAAVYLRASLRGQRTADWVAGEFECSIATAGRWVAAAKDSGHLKVADTRRR
jgi:hypothetical protein